MKKAENHSKDHVGKYEILLLIINLIAVFHLGCARLLPNRL
jgi:hypothetical protein